MHNDCSRVDRWNELAAQPGAVPVVLDRFRYAVALKAILGLPEDSAILEAGSGGRMLRALGALGYRNVTALELRPGPLDPARRAGATSADPIGGGAVPLADASFDAVISAAAIDHAADPRSWLIALARVLKPGGILSFTGKTYMWKWLAKLGLEQPARAAHAPIWPGKLLTWADEAGLQAIGCGGFTNVPDQRFCFLRQLGRWISPRRRYDAWRGIHNRQDRPIAAYEHLEEIPAILDAVDLQPLLAGNHLWQAIFSYESYYYFRKRGEAAAIARQESGAAAAEAGYRAAA
jgi:SAM-dependent methyltransferase